MSSPIHATRASSPTLPTIRYPGARLTRLKGVPDRCGPLHVALRPSKAPVLLQEGKGLLRRPELSLWCQRLQQLIQDTRGHEVAGAGGEAATLVQYLEEGRGGRVGECVTE